MTTTTATKPQAPNGAGVSSAVQTDGAPAAAEHANAWEALAAMQGDIPTVGFDRSNPHFGNRYATLSAIWEAVRPILARHGFAFLTRPGVDGEDGRNVLAYALVWRDGTVVADGSYPLPLASVKPQEMGSAVTYARRYTMCAVLGIVADEDDDGEAANKAAASRPPATPSPARQRAQTQQAQTQRAPGEQPAEACAQCAAEGWMSAKGSVPRYYVGKFGRQCNGLDADGGYANHRPAKATDPDPTVTGETDGRLPWDE